MKYNTALSNFRFSRLLLFPERGNEPYFLFVGRRINLPVDPGRLVWYHVYMQFGKGARRSPEADIARLIKYFFTAH